MTFTPANQPPAPIDDLIAEAIEAIKSQEWEAYCEQIGPQSLQAYEWEQALRAERSRWEYAQGHRFFFGDEYWSDITGELLPVVTIVR